jgi:hypothetical protein
MRALLQRVAGGSPLLPAMIYTAAVWLANLVATVAPDSVALLLPALLVWAVLGILLVVVVTWFRTDDWLSAGFLLGLTLILSGWSADVLAEAVKQGSLVPALFAAPGMLLGVMIRAIISVPALGGLVALLRWVTRLVRPARQRPAPGAPRG